MGEMQQFSSLREMYEVLVPSFKSRQWTGLYVHLRQFESEVAREVREWSPLTVRNRWEAYVSPEEIVRVKAIGFDQSHGTAFRFGVKKKGHGNSGVRDFCMLAGVIHRRHLTLMYRCLEMSRGFVFDLTVIERLGRELGIDWRSLTLFACHAKLHAVSAGASRSLGKNEVLYHHFMKYLRSGERR